MLWHRLAAAALIQAKNVHMPQVCSKKEKDKEKKNVMKARKMKNRLIKLEVKKLQKAPFLKASPKKALAAAKGHATKFPPKKKKKSLLQAERLLPRKLQARSQHIIQKLRSVRKLQPREHLLQSHWKEA